MGSLARALAVAVLGPALAGALPHRASGENAYYPAAVDPRTQPVWEMPKLTRFRAIRCGGGVRPVIDKLTLNRDDAIDSHGPAGFIGSLSHGVQAGAGTWTLQGAQLRVSGDGVRLEGRWVGPFLSATVTGPDGRQARCRFQVPALRDFVAYE